MRLKWTTSPPKYLFSGLAFRYISFVGIDFNYPIFVPRSTLVPNPIRLREVPAPFDIEM
jgi:hypothetical protein